MSDTISRNSTKKSVDIYAYMRDFHESTLNAELSLYEMQTELKVSSIKVRASGGDLFSLNTVHPDLIRPLWMLRRLDDFVYSTRQKIAKEDLETFWKFVHTLREKLERQISSSAIKLPTAPNDTIPHIIEFERIVRRRKKHS